MPNYGFTLLKDEYIPEVDGKVRLYIHDKTKAQLLSIENDDNNKSFGITFRTPARKANGVAHIIEHSVLCGSRKYPVKEPFTELIKGSLSSFVNALTYPDKTSYPIASQNTRDFYNMIDVYMDAVLYPKLTKETFEQEGWHYELDTPEAPIQYKGIVLNEMKGVYSSPDQLLQDGIFQSLFPDTIYSNDSGGDPNLIPTLTYEEFIDFHQTYYHPSNSLIFFSGNDDLEERLRFLDSYLREFPYKKIDASIPIQKSLPPNVVTKRFYPIDQSESIEKKNAFTLNWLLPIITDEQVLLELEILEYLMLGTSASPLRRALIESGIGEDLAGFGLENNLLQHIFSTGLKGVRVGDVKKIEEIIISTLTNLAKRGFDSKDIAAALNTVEFQLRENNTGSFPKGLSYMFRSLSSWVYGEDPLKALRFETVLTTIKGKIESKQMVFSSLISTYLLENTNRTQVLLQADHSYANQVDQIEKDKLDAYKKSLSADEITSIIEHTKLLHQLQEKPNSPQDLAKLPRLKREDLDPLIQSYPKNNQTIDDATVLTHELPTNGIIYMDFGWDAHSLESELLPYLPLFCRALFEMGTKSEGYIQFQQRFHTQTGGMGASLLPITPEDSKNSKLYLLIKAKFLPTQLDDVFSIVADIINITDFSNKEKFRQILLEEKAGMESVLVDNGHRFVHARIASMYSQSGWISEQFHGVSQLLFLRSLSNSFDSQWEEIQHTLSRIATLLFTKEQSIFNVTCEKEHMKAVEKEIAGFLPTLSLQKNQAQVWPTSNSKQDEVLVVQTNVNFVGKGSLLYSKTQSYKGSDAVSARYLELTWLWEQVRMKGGAYGGFNSLDRLTGIYASLSYRDPRLLETIASFDQSSTYLQALTISEDELTKAIIGTISDFDQYLLPDAKGWTSFVQHLSKISDDERQRRRNEVLSTTSQDFNRLGKLLESVNEQGNVVVMTSKQHINTLTTAYPSIHAIVLG